MHIEIVSFRRCLLHRLQQFHFCLCYNMLVHELSKVRISVLNRPTLRILSLMTIQPQHKLPKVLTLERYAILSTLLK